MTATLRLPTSDLPLKANALRNVVLEMGIARGGHISTSFSCMEILVALYYGDILQIDPADPAWPQRDRFILSKGHAETVLYAVLADRGFFPSAWLIDSYRTGLCRLGGHVDSKVPGIELSTGALGHGLGVGCGLALGARMDGSPWSTYVLLGDAECSEGSVWEAAMFAAQHGLGNLTAIVDRNFIGSLDHTRNYVALEPLADKWRAFGWDATEVEDGHDFATLLDTLPASKGSGERPRALIVKTVKGKGITFMEDDPTWHVRAVTPDLVDRAREDLQWKP